MVKPHKVTVSAPKLVWDAIPHVGMIFHRASGDLAENLTDDQAGALDDAVEKLAKSWGVKPFQVLMVAAIGAVSELWPKIEEKKRQEFLKGGGE